MCSGLLPRPINIRDSSWVSPGALSLGPSLCNRPQGTSRGPQGTQTHRRALLWHMYGQWVPRGRLVGRAIPQTSGRTTHHAPAWPPNQLQTHNLTRKALLLAGPRADAAHSPPDAAHSPPDVEPSPGPDNQHIVPMVRLHHLMQTPEASTPPCGTSASHRLHNHPQPPGCLYVCGPQTRGGLPKC